MRYVLRTFFGLALIAGTATVCAYAIFQLLQIGTCASGGPYVSARQCPDGIERLMFLIVGGVFCAFLGLFLFASRGDPPGGAGKRRASAAILMWSALFLGISFGCFWGVWGPDANPGPGGKEGGLIVAFLFAIMGLVPLPMLFSGGKAYSVESGMKTLSGMRSTMRSGQAPTVAAPASSPPITAGGDEVARLERLHGLRAQGAITQEEYEKLKRKIMEGP